MTQLPPDTVSRIDQNFTRLDEFARDVVARISKLERRPRVRKPRSRRDARINPDDILLFWIVGAGTVLFIGAVFAMSFSGQRAMGEFTALPEGLWLLIPLAIDWPILMSALLRPVFLRRGQDGAARAAGAFMALLVVLSAWLNAAHVFIERGFELTVETLTGAGVMALMPVLLLIGWELLIKLAIKPPTKQERVQQDTLPIKKKGARR